MDHEEASAHIAVKYRTYVFVWIGLLTLTWLTVTIAGTHIAGISIFVPLLIATLKASLVLSFFMHLKYEKGLFRIIVLITVIVITILVWLVFSDVAYR